MTTDNQGFPVLAVGNGSVYDQVNAVFSQVDKGRLMQHVAALTLTDEDWTVADGAGKVKKAIADTEANANVIGLVKEGAVLDENVFSQINGVRQKDSWGLTANSVYYLSQSVPGAMTTTKPSSGIVMQLGFTLAATDTFYVMMRCISNGDGGDPAVWDYLVVAKDRDWDK